MKENDKFVLIMVWGIDLYLYHRTSITMFKVESFFELAIKGLFSNVFISLFFLLFCSPK